MQEKHYDAIIIGSGLGGLSAGATLARAGKKVLVLEQHSLIGGCATCFKRKGMSVDAGLHEMDWGDPKTDMKQFVFKKLGIDEKIKIIPLPSAWSIVIHNGEKIKELTIPHGQEKVKEVLKQEFPHESAGIDAYFKAINQQAYAVRKFPWDLGFLDFFFFPITTAWIFAKNIISNAKVSDVLDKMIKDSKLKRILNINLSYYHHDPKSFIWSFHAIPQKHYYDQGVYVKGGSQSISDALVEVIVENGGEVRAKSDVLEILSEGSKAIGVRYFDSVNKIQENVYGENIIANCDPAIVYRELLGGKGINLDAEIKKDESKPIATSLVSAYLIYDKNISELYPNMDYSTFIMQDKVYQAPFEQSNVYDLEIKDRPLAFINYSKIENGLSQKDDRHLGVVALASHMQEWENLNDEEYKEKKAVVLDEILKILDQQFPNLSSHMIHAELATPKTIRRYTRTREGTPYGYSQDKEGQGYRLDWKSRSVKNLYFASAFTFPGGGFTGAILSGYRTACGILDPYSMLKRLGLCFVFGFAVVEGIIWGIKALL